ncbi:MAG: TPM domain-containing protein [Hyphomicrobiales bacterium]|nr:TPM domain-containing protein [Hyphomicrobiales bacterium]
MVVLSDEEHERVSAAIRAAEARTSGEIYCAVCRQSDPYFLAAAFVFSSVALVLGFVFSWALHWLWIDIGPTELTGAQLAAWAIGIIILWRVPALRLLMVPRGVSYRRAHANALQQFFGRNIHVTEARTGVLIFVSIAERYAEIVADSGISAKVAQEEWNEIVEGLTAGASRQQLADALVEAVNRSGTLLETHFPPGTGDKNELPDHIVEL